MKKEWSGPDRIAKEVWRVSGPDMTDQRDCASYLLDLGDLILIDSGSGMGFDRMVRNIGSLGYDPADISTVILTHCHFDHIGGAVRFRDQFGSRLVMHDFDARLIEAGDQRLTAAFCFNAYLTPFTIDVRLEGERQDLRFSAGTLTFLHTPGHTPGSVSLYMDRGGVRMLFAQDIGAPLLKEFDCDAQAWIKSVAKLFDLKADILCDGHSGAYGPARVVAEYLQYCVNYQVEQGYLIDQS